ncbi:glutaminyl-peptide cyclotransferase [Reichenbachiella agarivorans]|uniref:Glutaminyl-peptide cyclotransferase n=1 Tax=Reichenbachiella agarivorans TaxID=2979464 RepID=A0ABY6CN27_9BACT|nr:glutaminyl-peptide cyclotransferase [Reichenbachiella agarivorans]UXP30878.1 glutaminyl-peptide cyclotransferase [Reichenbachiella agarivorans]
MESINILKTCALLITLSFVLTCCDVKRETSTPDKTTRTQFTKIISPQNNSTFKLGEDINFQIHSSSQEITIDSVICTLDGESLFKIHQDTTHLWSTNQHKTGSCSLILNIYLSNQTVERRIVNLTFLTGKEPEKLTYRIINTFPHDPNAYTQGLLVNDNKLYESTGQKGESSVRQVDLQSGTILRKKDIDQQFFGEGIAIKGDSLYMLTWESTKGFIFNKNTFDKLGEFYYDTEGWGLTTLNNDSLVMSDGSNKLYFKSPINFTNLGSIEVYDHRGPIDYLNEIEYINGKIFANRYQTDKIYVIDPKTGSVEYVLDMSGIFDSKNYQKRIDVLNGIAFNDLTKTYYITGKWWPKLFEIEIINLQHEPI